MTKSMKEANRDKITEIEAVTPLNEKAEIYYNQLEQNDLTIYNLKRLLKRYEKSSEAGMKIENAISSAMKIKRFLTTKISHLNKFAQQESFTSPAREIKKCKSLIFEINCIIHNIETVTQGFDLESIAAINAEISLKTAKATKGFLADKLFELQKEENVELGY